MHALKLIVLLLLVLIVLRLSSWALGWLVFRVARIARRASAAAGNAIAFGLFAGFLAWDRLPGEPFDFAAHLFGLGVFAAFLLLDFRWTPWRERSAAGQPAPEDRRSAAR